MVANKAVVVNDVVFLGLIPDFSRFPGCQIPLSHKVDLILIQTKERGKGGAAQIHEDFHERSFVS